MICFPLFNIICYPILQSRQPVFVKLLRSAFRVSQCSWLSGSQKYHVEACIKALSDIGNYSNKKGGKLMCAHVTYLGRACWHLPVPEHSAREKNSYWALILKGPRQTEFRNGQEVLLVYLVFRHQVSGVLNIFPERPEILVRKTNGMCHPDWKVRENSVFRLR